MLEHGLASEPGRAAIRRMNQMRGAYPISDDDKRYVLCTFVTSPIRWIDSYGWRRLTEPEKTASAKRPYGNSNVYADIAEILEIPEDEWSDDMEPFPEATWRFLRLHVETGVALQIALATGEFRPGRYVRASGWENTWKRAEDQP